MSPKWHIEALKPLTLLEEIERAEFERPIPNRPSPTFWEDLRDDMRRTSNEMRWWRQEWWGDTHGYMEGVPCATE